MNAEDDAYPEEWARLRFDAALRGAFKTPPTPKRLIRKKRRAPPPETTGKTREPHRTRPTR